MCQTLLDDSTRKREFEPMKAIGDNYPKTVLSLDRVGVGDYAGIRQANVVDWLLEDEG